MGGAVAAIGMKIVGGVSKGMMIIAELGAMLSEKTLSFTTKFLGFIGKMMGFVGKIFGPILSIFEIGKDLAQSFGFFADGGEQKKAQERLSGGLKGAAVGGIAGSFIPGLGTLMGALTGYSIGAAVEGGFARGTDNMVQGGAALVGERGPEIVTIPTGASVIPNGAFARGNGPYSGSQQGGSARDVTVHVKLDVNDRKFKELITLNTIDVIEGKGMSYA